MSKADDTLQTLFDLAANQSFELLITADPDAEGGDWFTARIRYMDGIYIQREGESDPYPSLEDAVAVAVYRVEQAGR